MNNVWGIKATKQTCNGNFRLWTSRWSMRCLERIATFYLPMYLIATYIVEITSGWRVIETIASFCTIFYRTPCKTKIKKSHNIFNANNSVILTLKMFDQCFQELSTSGKLAIHKIATNLVKILWKSIQIHVHKKISPILLQHWWLLPGPVENGIIIMHKPWIQKEKYGRRKN